MRVPKPQARKALKPLRGTKSPVALSKNVKVRIDICRRRGETRGRGLSDQAVWRQCLELCSIQTGVGLILSRLAARRIRGLIASLRRARRNASMKKTAAPQTLVNANDPITWIGEQGKGQARGRVNLQNPM
jgi:hypothetical protein